MQFKIAVNLFFIVFLSHFSFAQQNRKPEINLIQKNIGKEVLIQKKTESSRFTYLGKIIDEKGNLQYYVVTEFKKFKAAVVYHGQSKVIFYNSTKKFVAQYHFDMPNDLPIQLKSNELYFKSENGKISKQKIGPILPKMLCSKEAGCSEINLTV